MNRLIFHIDVNSAFLSWESVRRVKQGLPDLRNVPACIGGDPKKRTGIVVAKSIPAKKYGVQTGEPVAMALRKCPDLVIAKSDFELYIKCSRAFKEICASYAPVMESFSIDEVFLDMTGTSLIYPDPVRTAHEIKDKIRNELGFTVMWGFLRTNFWQKWHLILRNRIRCILFFQRRFRRRCGRFRYVIFCFWVKLPRRN